uniref:Uncharacterized protein n=1 Tax=Panagrolaimus davidi TaxID=227884 RepID=A0A914QTN7_9BILA
MLLYFSEENFKTEDTVIALWIKNDYFVFHKYKNGYLTQIDRIKVCDEKFEKKFDKIVKIREPKFVVMGSTEVLKQVKGHLKAKEVKMVKNTFLQCLQKSAGYLLGQMLRSQKCRWNFKVQLFNCFKLEIRSGTGYSSISSGAIDSLPFHSTLNLPRVVTSLKGSTKFLYGRHVSFHNDLKVKVEVDEDGFLHLALPKMYSSFCCNDVAMEYISYKNDEYMEDFIYITTSDPDQKVLEAWTIVNRRLMKKKFTGDTLLKDMNIYLMKLQKTSVDAIVLNLYQHSDPEFLWNARRHFKKLCERQKIPFKFVTKESLLLSLLLLKSKINLSQNFAFTVVYIYESKLKFTQINSSSNKIEIAETFEDVFESGSPLDTIGHLASILTKECDYFICSFNTEDPMHELFELFFPMCKTFFNKKTNTIMIKDNFEQCFTSVSTSLFLQMFNSKSSKWNIISPTCPCSEVNVEYENDFEYAIFEQDIPNYPCTKSFPLSKKALRFHHGRSVGNGYFSDYSETNKNTVQVDISEDGFTHFCFPSKFAAFDGDSKVYKEFAKKLNAIVTNRKPVIIFPEDIAILFVYENGTYAPININGRKELRAVISFAEEDPVFGNSAMESRINDDSSVVVYGRFNFL